ncbi:MAG: TlpA family protein disulfide reductase [Ekhidna sp.]
MVKLFFLIFTILFFLSSCEKKDERSELSQSINSLSKDDQFRLLSSERLAPNDTLISYDGSKILLSEIDGDIIVIDFWATWCSPCYKAIPKFHDLASKYKSNQVNFILVSIDSDIDFWKSEALQNEWTDKSYWIGDEGFKNKLYSLVYEELELEDGKSIVTALPHYLIITKAGEIHLNTAQTTPAAVSFKESIDSLVQALKF